MEKKALPARTGFNSYTLLQIVIIGFLGLYTVFFLYRALRYLAFPYPLDPGDGPVLNVASQLAQGNGIYRDIQELPFISANYTPLYYAINAIAIRLIGPSFFPGRLVSVISTIGLAFLIFKIVSPMSKNRYAATITSLTFLSLGPVYQWGAVYKADMTAIALSMLGIYLLVRERPMPVLSSLILLLAFLTKQSAATALAAGTLYLTLRLYHGDRQAWRNFFYYNLTAGVIGFAILFFLDFASEGRLYEHIVSVNLQRQFWLEQEVIALTYFGAAHFLIAGIAVKGAFKSILSLKDGWSLYFLIALLAMIVGIGRLGSSNNYCIESLTIACILFGFFLAKQSYFSKRLLMLALVQILLLFHLPHIFEPGPTPDGKELAISAQLQERIAATQMAVFAENSGWLPIAGHAVILDDTFFFAEMARAGDWNQNTIVNMFQQKSFSLLVLEFDPFMAEDAEWYHTVRFTPQMLGAITRQYQLERTVGEYYLLVPRGRGELGAGR